VRIDPKDITGSFRPEFNFVDEDYSRGGEVSGRLAGEVRSVIDAALA